MSVADPGFPAGEGGREPPMWALFSKSVCKNERTGSRRGRGRAPDTPPRSANECIKVEHSVIDSLTHTYI